MMKQARLIKTAILLLTIARDGKAKIVALYVLSAKNSSGDGSGSSRYASAAIRDGGCGMECMAIAMDIDHLQRHPQAQNHRSHRQHQLQRHVQMSTIHRASAISNCDRWCHLMRNLCLPPSPPFAVSTNAVPAAGGASV